MKRGLPLCLALMLGGTTSALAKNVKIHWSAIKGANQYELQILLAGKAVKAERTSSDTTTWSGDMPTGAYTYQVRGIDRLDQPGKWSAFQTFFVAPPAPETVSPENNAEFEAQPTAKIKMQWEAVKGANRYVAEIKYGKRSVFKKVVTTTDAESTPLAPGKYTWSVRSLVELGEKAPKGADPAKGNGPWAKDVAFTIFPPGKRGLASQSLMTWSPKSRQMTLDLDVAAGSYTYANDSPNDANDGTTSAIFTGVEAGLGYQLTKDWKASLGLELNFFKINEIAFNRKVFELMTGYAFHVGSAFQIVPEVGVRAQDYFSFFRPDRDTAATLTTVMAAGPAVGARFVFDVSSKSQLELFARYNLPSKLLTAPAGTTFNSAGSNYSAGATGRYYMGPDWAIHLQVGYRNQPLAYTLSGSAAPESTTYKAVHALVGVSFQLGSELR